MLSLGLTSYDMELWFNDLFTSYEMELETHVHVWYCVVHAIMVWYVELVWYGMLVWYDVSMLCTCYVIIGYCRV